jgi:hypothetical protein
VTATAILGHEAPAEAFVEMLTATFEKGVHRAKISSVKL